MMAIIEAEYLNIASTAKLHLSEDYFCAMHFPKKMGYSKRLGGGIELEMVIRLSWPPYVLVAMAAEA